MKKLIILAIIVALAACGTTPVQQTNIGSKNNPIIRPNFAGAPQESVIAVSSYRRFPNVTESNGKKFQLIANYMHGDSGESLPDQALSLLDSMSPTNLNAYEITLFHQYRGYAFIAKKKPFNAIEQFEIMLQKPENMPLTTEADATRTLSLLYCSVEKYDLCLAQMYKLPALTERINSSDYYRVSLTQEKLGDISNAIINANKAREMERLSSPKNFNVLSQYLASLYEKNNEPLKAEDIRAQKNPSTTTNNPEGPIPIVKVAPVYPKEAIRQRVQGYCLVTFTVNERGSVEDAHVTPGDCKTLQGEPGDVFAQASIDAVSKFKYRPIMENGKPVKFYGMKNKVVYAIEE